MCRDDNSRANKLAQQAYPITIFIVAYFFITKKLMACLASINMADQHDNSAKKMMISKDSRRARLEEDYY
jgi:hypothetical protein